MITRNQEEGTPPMLSIESIRELEPEIDDEGRLTVSGVVWTDEPRALAEALHQLGMRIVAAAHAKKDPAPLTVVFKGYVDSTYGDARVARLTVVGGGDGEPDIAGRDL